MKKTTLAIKSKYTAAIATSRLILVVAIVLAAAISIAFTGFIGSASSPQTKSSTCSVQASYYGISQCSSKSASKGIDTTSISTATSTCSAQATSGSKSCKAVTVSIVSGAHNSAQANNFVPGSIIVVIGYNNTVTWVNNDSTQHTVTSDTGAFSSGIVNPSATFSYTFTTPGVYSYHCSIHPFMKGTIQVVTAA